MRVHHTCRASGAHPPSANCAKASANKPGCTTSIPLQAPKRSQRRKPCSEGCRWDSSPSFEDSCRRQHGTTQSHTSMQRDTEWLASAASRRHPTPANRGAARPDLFGLLWEVTPHRSSSSPQVKPLRLSDVAEHFGRGDHFASLRPICSQMQGPAIQQVLTAVTCAYSPARRHSLLPTDGCAKPLRTPCEAGRCTDSDVRKREAAGRGGCSCVPSGTVRCGSGPFSARVAPNLLPDPGLTRLLRAG